jgi:Putative MetA-pathway of phenol degradation
MTAKSFVIVALLACAAPAAAQQRPLDTQDPETIGAGRVLIEGGIYGAHDMTYPLSGLTGNLWQIPVLGIDVGISSIADLQITGGPYNHLTITSRQPAPLADQVTTTDDSTHAVEDITFGAKIRIAGETEGRPSFGFRFATRLPNAKHRSGIAQGTTDFGISLLVGKTIQSVRVVGNVGWVIMSEPLDAAKQNDVITYGFSLARALTERTEIVGEINGRLSTRNGVAPIGTESRGLVTLGGRFTQGPVRFDAAVFFGLHAIDPTVGLTAGVTYVFNAFTVP